MANTKSRQSEGSVLGAYFAENMRIRRMKMGYTQVRMAELLGIQQSTYAHYEGHRRSPLLHTMERIARVFGCTVIEMLSPPPKE
jgi:transcriptional regulator with XRE-family HTH domain